MHMFQVGSTDPSGGSLNFSEGGQQGGRNWCTCDQCTYAGAWCGQNQDPPDNNDTRLISGTWLVENVLDELDVPGEFFLDRHTGLLYLFPNATDTNTTHGSGTSAGGSAASDSSHFPDLRLAVLESLIEVRGSDISPIEGVHIEGLGFRDTAATFLGNWSAPSGGDWALHRGGAVFLEAARNVTIRQCRFRRLDTNAVFLSRFTRDVVVERSAFEWIGESAVATWGETKGFDATEGLQPQGTVIQDNLMRELGILQKQSSGVGQAKAALTTIRRNGRFTCMAFTCDG